MRKTKWLVVLLLLCCAQVARGQCSNGPCYTANAKKTLLTPQQAANQGFVTATLNLTASGSNVASHKMIAGAGTDLTYTWSCGNATSLSLYTAWDSGTWTLWQSGLACGGSGQLNNIGPAGHVLGIKLVGTGPNGSSQDVNRLTITGDPPGTVSQDSGDPGAGNFYLLMTSSGGGGSMMNDYTICQGGNQQHCINATHTPFTTNSLSNTTSGEVQSHAKHQSGNVANSTSSVSFGDSIAISVLPGDDLSYSEIDEVVCSISGPIGIDGGGSNFPSMTAEIAFTKVALKVPTHCTPITNSKGQTIGLHCDIAYYCSPKSSPPDYQPNALNTYHFTNPATVPPFWMSASIGTAIVTGSGPQTVAVWLFPLSTLNGVLTGVGGTDPFDLGIFSPAWESDSSSQDCTSWVKGISPWYIPRW